MRRILLVLASVVFLAGCSVSRTAGHVDVARLIEQRTGQRTHWEQGTMEDAQVADVVNKLLKDGLTRERAIEIALVNNRSLQATYEDLDVSQAEMVQAGLLKNPSLSFGLGFPLNPMSALELEGSIVQEFLDLLTLPLRKKIARERFNAAILRVAHQAFQVAVDVLGQLVVFGAVGAVPVVKRDVKAVQILLAARGDIGHERLRCLARLFGRDHDRRAVRVVGADEMHRAALHALVPHPDVGLDVFHDVADVELAVGVRQGGGDEEFACGHGSGFLAEPAILGVCLLAPQGQGRARVHMGAHALQHFPFPAVVFHELRRQFDCIPFDAVQKERRAQVSCSNFSASFGKVTAHRSIFFLKTSLFSISAPR